MVQLVKLKQIESGPAIQAAIAVTAIAHPAAILTNNAAPFAFNPAAQTGNIPQTPVFSVAGNTITYNPGNGSIPVTYTPTLSTDVFIASGQYNPVNGNLELVLTNGSTILIPLADLQPIVTVDTPTVDLTGQGTSGSPIAAQVIFSAAPGNLAVNNGTGVFVSVNSIGNQGINISGLGTLASPIVPQLVLDPAETNALSLSAAGLFVPVVTPTPPTAVLPTKTVNVIGTGQVPSPFQFAVKLQPDGPNVQNFIHNPTTTGSGSTNQGLGYSQITTDFVGVGPFNLTATVAGVGWTSGFEVVKIDGHINGVYYSSVDGWNYTNLTAVTWDNVLFALEASDELTFTVHIRAV